MARSPDFDLAKALASPSFTPGQRDASALVELVVAGEEPTDARAAAALTKLGDAGRAAIDRRLAGQSPIGGDTAELGDAATSRLVGALGLCARAGDTTARALVIARTRDPHVRVRRAAISALGKLDGDDIREALLARWDGSDVAPDERRTLAEALGKVGGEAARTRLATLDAGTDAELARRRDRALLMVDRDARRDADSTIAIDVPPPRPLAIVLRCRAGLSPLLVEELAQSNIAATAVRDDAATLTLDRTSVGWSALHASRLWTTGAVRIALPADARDDVTEHITRTLLSPAVRELWAAWTRGPIRWRLGFAQGHKRSIVWSVAKEVSTAAPELVNDPTNTTWDVLVDDDLRHLDLVPRRAPDPRFAWRVADVPAASHPTVAAALAFVAGVREGDRVWDPFVGSGAELVECARRAPCSRLVGTDLDDAALAAARKNLETANVRGELVRADARTFAAGPVDLIVTNPPLGSRVQLDAKSLLVGALPHFVAQLAPGGRLVWITPAPKHTAPVAERLGLRRTRMLAVDLGGVRGTLERWDLARR